MCYLSFLVFSVFSQALSQWEMEEQEDIQGKEGRKEENVLKDGLQTVHDPYAYGFAIILLTVIVKVATLPLTKQQVESTLAMQNLQPKIKAIQERYAGNQVKNLTASFIAMQFANKDSESTVSENRVI
ncbi:hypothetical protein ACHQM5_016464 [Ranunculus cassubicifolius]